MIKSVIVLVSLSQAGVQGLVLEVEPSTGDQNCTQLMTRIQKTITIASELFHSATSPSVQFPDVDVVVPSLWTDCNTTAGPVPSSRSVDVWLTTRPTRSVQPGGCGVKGSHVDLNYQLLEDTQEAGKTLMLLTTKHLYGVFDEFGEYNNSRFPAFYKKGLDLHPTSCTNLPINGSFRDCDMLSDCLEMIEENQTHIITSLFYNTNTKLYPQMSQFCNSSDHQTDAPTPHNLICRGKSMMEVINDIAGDNNDIAGENNDIAGDNNDTINDIAGDNNDTIRPPEVKFFQRRKVKQFILFVDRGPAMAASGQRFWNIFRTGWEQFIVLIEDTTRISIRFQEDPYNITNITWPDKNQGGYWEHLIFPQFIDGISPHNLSAFEIIRNNTELMENLNYPEIIVVSGSDILAADGEAESEVVNWINQNKIPVHIFTFSSVKNSALLQLTLHGTLYSVPAVSSESVCNYFASSVFRQISNAIHGREVQDKVFQLHDQDLPIQNANFSIGNDELGGNLLFLSGQQLGQNALNVKIEIQSPDGVVHSITRGDILAVFSPGYIYKLNTNLSAGNWTLINLSLGDGTSLGEESMYVVHQFNGSPRIRQTWVGGGNTPFNWNQSNPVIPVYVDVGSDGSGASPVFHCSVLAPGTGGCHNLLTPGTGECHNLTFHDDGLLAPDTAEKDGIYSGYLYDVPTAGYYSIITSSPPSSPSLDQLKSSLVSISPGFFVSSPSPEERPDVIPPARITDLVIVEEDKDAEKIVLQFTEPGNDYFDHGDAETYFVYCGYNQDVLSYDSCDSVRGTIKFATEARARKTITLPVVTKNRQVYIGVVAQDAAGNRPEMSNVVSFFMEGPTTSTTSTTSTVNSTPVTSAPSTTKPAESTPPPPSTTTDGSTIPGPGTFVTYAELWGITGTLVGLLVLILLAIFISHVFHAPLKAAYIRFRGICSKIKHNYC